MSYKLTVTNMYDWCFGKQDSQVFVTQDGKLWFITQVLMVI